MFLRAFVRYLIIIVLLTSALVLRASAAIATIMISISLLIAIVFSKGLSKQVKELNAALYNLASGDFSARIFSKNRGMLKGIGDSFNHMAEQVRLSFRELSGQRRQLNSIISSIHEGLMVLDGKGKILLSNESLNKIIQSSSVKGKFYWEIVRAFGFSELIKKTMEEGKDASGEVALHDKILLCNTRLLNPKGEILVTFLNITDMRNLERVKRDFVANLSHELRTPLTSIKGFVETLEEGITSKEERHYLDVIKRNTERLINIVKDLLLLSELEGDRAVLELEETNLKTLVEDVLKIFEQRLKEKNLSLTLDVDPALTTIRADPFKLEQMLINVIENAVRYTERGGISILLKNKDDQVVIEIADTGIGILEKHLPRIFERFYVVDKSRSRKLGGTGLGLSIVKHIVLLHGGKIDVESTYGLGTKFTITLPKYGGITT